MHIRVVYSQYRPRYVIFAFCASPAGLVPALTFAVPPVPQPEVITLSILSRRSVMLAAPAISLGAVGTAAFADTAAAADPSSILSFTARRTKTTLPNVPAVTPDLGFGFIAYLALLDEGGKALGDGSVRGVIVDIIVGLPPKLVVQASAIFRFGADEIHTSNMHIRTIPNPGTRHLIAITGGTGAYRTARGSGTIEHVTDTDTVVVLNVFVDPPA